MDAMTALSSKSNEEVARDNKMYELVQELRDHPGTYLIFDRRTRRETWEAANEGKRRGLLVHDFVEIDDQETQYQIRLASNPT